MDVAASVVIILALGGTALLYRRRAPGVRRPMLGKLAASVDRMREMADRESKYRPAPADGSAFLDDANYYDMVRAELVRAGCRELGDLVQERLDGTLTMPTRWFVDDAGTACGWFGIVPTSMARQVMILFSEGANGEYYVTSRGGANSGTASPPTEHRASCRWADGLAQQLQVHRAQIPAADGASLTKVGTLDEATSLVDRMRKAKAAWRAKQSYDALLEKDLRQILQDRYPSVGPALLSYMKSRVPAR
jgi:hypothetical protein